MSRQPDTTVIVNWRDLDHPSAGGAEVYCQEVAARLSATGRRVVLLTAAVSGRPSSERRDGYTIVRGGGRFGVYPRALAWLWWHRRRVAGVIDSQNGVPFFAPLAVRARTPVVLLMHHVHQDQFNGYFSPLVARFGRWLEGPVSRRVYGLRSIVAVSPSTRRSVRRVLRLQGPIHIASPGCQPVVGADLDGRSATPRIVCVGRMVPHKRIQLLLAALPAVVAAHPGTELHLVGDGPERSELERLAAGIDATIVFHGALPSARRDEIVRSAWVAANPSSGEGWGISVIEANAFGRPVVAFRVPGLRDSILDGETGWLVDEDGDLAARLIGSITVLADNEEAQRWSRNTASWAARADWDKTARHLDEALEAERGRLSHTDRRQHTDLTTHAHLPASLLAPDWEPTFRLTDRPAWTSGGLSILLPGTDLSDAITALRRAGLPASAAADPRLAVRIARPSDFIDAAAGVELPLHRRPEPPVLTLIGHETSAIS